MKTVIKRIPGLVSAYTKADRFLKAFFPRFHAKYAYRIAYGKPCNLKNPQTLSEKLLWLSLNTYRNNRQIMDLCDKYRVREFVAEKAGEDYLNELYKVYNSIESIRFDEMPEQFALKISQGCGTNIICDNKTSYGENRFYSELKEWRKKQGIYDKIICDVGGIRRKELKKYYICERLLKEKGKKSPTDYKFYCFNGEPKAILVISDRFENKTGLFMNLDWTVLSELTGAYHKPDKVYDRPNALEQMIEMAKKLSQGFPFVRVDMYDVDGKAIFGEMTFFPNGCIHLQETLVEGKSMGELLDISYLQRV